MNWKRNAQIFLMGAAFLIAGCGMGNREEIASSAAAIRQEQAFPVVVENYDSQGHEVATTYEKPPQKIIALWQNSIETLLELGAKDRIVAVSGVDDVRHLTEENQKIYSTLPLMTKYTLNQDRKSVV